MLDSLLAATSGGDQITLDTVNSVVLWNKITTGVGDFITGVFMPVMNVVANSEAALAFLSVSFFFLAVRGVRRTVGAFGRGH